MVFRKNTQKFYRKSLRLDHLNGTYIAIFYFKEISRYIRK